MCCFYNNDKDMTIASRKNSKYAISREIFKAEIQSKLNNLYYFISFFKFLI
jgi:hypothetical protein